MRHGTSNANGHGMPCDEGFPISAASKDTVGRIPPTCQHLMLRVSSGEGSSLFCTLLFPKNLDRSKLWSFSSLDFRYPHPRMPCQQGAGGSLRPKGYETAGFWRGEGKGTHVGAIF